jgi:predicted nucleic acid-binding protein
VTATLVVDANVALLWSIKVPLSDKATDILRNGRHIIAPDLIIPEVTNAWAMIVRQGKNTADLAKDSLAQLPRWFSELVPSAILRDKAFHLALQLDHPAYDCFYLALAQMRDVKLVTRDAHFERKAEAAGLGQYVVALESWTES